MLMVPAILGILVFIYSAVTVMDPNVNHAEGEVCRNAGRDAVGSRVICPECPDYCPFRNLTESCNLYRIAYLFDNDSTVVFAFFMSIWAALFMELWKRRQSVLVWEWDLASDDQEEQTRPEFEASVRTRRINPVTKHVEPFLPGWSKVGRLAFTTSFVIFLLLLVLVAVVAIIMFRMLLLMQVYRGTYKDSNSIWFSQARLLASLTAASLNLVVIVTLNKLYEYIATWLVNWEKPRTQSDFERSFTFKMFFFQFLNFYSPLIYIALFKGRQFEHPGQLGERADGRYNYMQGYAADNCDTSGCFYEMSIQLVVVMTGKQIANNLLEFLVPKLVTTWKTYFYTSGATGKSNSKEVASRWEQDYNLQAWNQMALFDEYLEMVIQYGFITIFVSAFPLAPFFALLNNILEVRLDAYKYTTQIRRPLAQKVKSIGAWLGILQTITYIAVVSNAVIIAHTSEFIPRLLYQYKYSPTTTQAGYVAFTLTPFNTARWATELTELPWPGPKYGPGNKETNQSLYTNYTCYFKAFRQAAPVELSLSEAWDYPASRDNILILAVKFAFVVAFEHVVSFIVGIIAVAIPDVPNSVALQMQREKLLARESKFESQLSRTKEQHSSEDFEEELQFGDQRR